MKSVRQKQIEQYVLEKEQVSIKELCDVFGIHPNTARADIKELVGKGVVEKSYGGVSAIQKKIPTDIVERKKRNIHSKEIIGKLAAATLNENDVVFVDSGSTALMMFQPDIVLPKNILVISNNLDVIWWVTKNTDFPVYALPGKIERQLNAFASIETIESLQGYNIGKAYIGVRSISGTGEISSNSNIDAKLKATAMQRSKKVYLLADCEKLNKPALYNYSSLSEIDYWVCDSVNDEILQLEREFKFELIHPQLDK